MYSVVPRKPRAVISCLELLNVMGNTKCLKQLSGLKSIAKDLKGLNISRILIMKVEGV